MSRRHTDLLDRLTVTFPCSEDWDAMTGNEQVRFCSHCDLSVHNLSEMTRGEALALVRKSEGRLCVRYYRRPDATVQTLPLHNIKRRASKIATSALTATLSLCSPALAQASSTTELPIQGRAYVSGKRDGARPDEQTRPGATLEGVVLDPNEAVIVGASITLVDEKTKRQYITTTAADGTFKFQSLPEASYTLKAESTGFQTKEISEFRLEANAERQLELKLDIGMVVMGGGMITMPVDVLVNAAARDELGKVKELLAAGMDVNIVDADTDTTALMEAVDNGNQEMVIVLLNAGADVNTKNKYGGTALLMLREQTTDEIVRTLITAGAKVNSKDEEGNTPLMIAASLGNAPVLQALLEAGAKVNAKNKDGETALMKAAAGEGHIEVVRALLIAGADVNKENNDGETALKLAEDYENLEIANLLRGYGAREPVSQ
jgi:Carboxypeptidase regulatory-like domain/Ankyrin repeats (many copies)